jgi:hypothetical protein
MFVYCEGFCRGVLIWSPITSVPAKPCTDHSAVTLGFAASHLVSQCICLCFNVACSHVCLLRSFLSRRTHYATNYLLGLAASPEVSFHSVAVLLYASASGCKVYNWKPSKFVQVRLCKVVFGPGLQGRAGHWRSAIMREIFFMKAPRF